MLINVVGRSDPFQRTIELLTKLLPVTVKVNPVPPTVVEEGLKPVKFGTGLFTVCVKTEEVLASKLLSPPYSAVMEWEPVEREEVMKVACPPLKVPVLSIVPPSLKLTVPVAVPLLAETVAVRVTD